jgi:uncharacterized pyridoxal phosphate-containing UPF0001 family protein
MANDISENVRLVRERMERAQSRAGVSGKVQLVAATKMNSAERVALAIAAGVDACGENRVQEMTEKLSQGAYVGAPLHFIGHLQKNKVNKVVGNVDLIESVDSPELLRLISARAKPCRRGGKDRRAGRYSAAAFGGGGGSGRDFCARSYDRSANFHKRGRKPPIFRRFV